MPYKDPEKRRATQAIYQARYAATEKGRGTQASYQATTEGILSQERHYQKRQRGGTSAEQD